VIFVYKEKFMKVSQVSVWVAGWFLAACNNPAADKPKAEVKPVESAPAVNESAAPAAEKKVELVLNESNTEVGFVGAKITGSHDGKLEKVSGIIIANGEDPATAKVFVTIYMASVKTAVEKLNNHLKSPDFFGVERFPTAGFKSASITPAGTEKGVFTVLGDLTMHGISKQIAFPAKIALADGKVHMESEFSINRKDFGIVYPGMPDDLIRDDVVIKLKIDAKL
jgi:polyisoprenoid-binding protein YceI